MKDLLEHAYSERGADSELLSEHELDEILFNSYELEKSLEQIQKYKGIQRQQIIDAFFEMYANLSSGIDDVIEDLTTFFNAAKAAGVRDQLFEYLDKRIKEQGAYQHRFSDVLNAIDVLPNSDLGSEQLFDLYHKLLLEGKINPIFKTRLLRQLSNFVQNNPEGMRWLLSKLDFTSYLSSTADDGIILIEEVINFYDNAGNLDNTGTSISFGGHGTPQELEYKWRQAIEQLEQAIDTPENNAFSNLKAKILCNKIKSNLSKSFKSSTPRDHLYTGVQEIARGIYGRGHGRTLYYTDNTEDVDALLDRIDQVRIFGDEHEDEDGAVLRHYGRNLENSLSTKLDKETLFKNYDIPVHDAEDLLTLIHPANSSLIEREYDIDFSDLSLKEQYFFLNYLKETTVAETNHMQHFTRHFGAPALRTFLALEHEGQDYGDRIVAFGTEHEEKAAEVFESYSALLDEADTLESYIAEELDCDTVDCAEIVAVARGRVLDEAHQYLKTAVESNDKESVSRLEEKLIEARKLSAAFQAAIAADDVGTVEEFKSFRNEVVSGLDISPEQVQVLSEIYRKNYQNYGYDEDSIAELVTAFTKKLQDTQTRVYIRRVGDNVLAFALTTDHPEDGTSYASGLNANPELKGVKQGITTVGQIVVDNKERGLITTGEASPDNFRGYSQLDHGWVATAVKSDELEQEAYMVDIAVFPAQEFPTKQLSRREILGHLDAEGEGEVEENGVIYWQTTDPTSTPKLERSGTQYVITRSLQAKSDEGISRYIFVLEPLTHSASTATAPQMPHVA